MGKLVPMVIAVLGLGAGVGAGVAMKPEAAPADAAEDVAAPAAEAAAPEDAGSSGEFVRMKNQFIIPVVITDRVEALVILSLSIEVASGGASTVYSHEPKLRAAFLQVLFDHANAGGFSGNFTQTGRMQALRRALTEAASSALGEAVTDVLILDMVRQDT